VVAECSSLGQCLHHAIHVYPGDRSTVAEILTAFSFKWRPSVCAEWSNRCRDVSVFQFFKMVAVRHLGFVLRVFGPPRKIILLVFVTVQNLVGISLAVSIICQFKCFASLA